MNSKTFRIYGKLHKAMIVLQVMSIVLIFACLLPQTASATENSDYKKVVITEQTATAVNYATRNSNELPAIPLPGQQKNPQGDADGNGEINYMDALLVLRHSVGLETLSDTVVARCDVDGRKGLSYMDALLILRYSVGLITKF